MKLRKPSIWRWMMAALAALAMSMGLAAQEKERAAKADQKEKPALSSGTLAGLEFRSIGPAVTSGRIAAVAVHPSKSHVYYVGVASGGVWKTENNGTTFKPVFDSQSSYSIGAVALDPTNPSTVWVGTGENNSQRSVSYGDGIYRSDDGGRKWKKMGLEQSEHIGRIVIHPENGDIVYVAAQGPLWGPGGDRGLFKTDDGGETWENVLDISEHTGVTDVVMDPRDPDVLYAASYQRRRRVWTMIDGGPESAIHKSVDGGETWKKLSSGLPSGDLGRIGLAISLADPDVLYAQVEAAEGKGGVFRSRDRGATWEKRNPFDGTAFYYSRIVADPKDVDRIYTLNTFAWKSEDGGRSLERLSNRGRHVDDHDLWIDPSNTDHLLIGGDGGLYESYDRGQTWLHKTTLPVTQFYRVDVDNDLPFYNIYGGTQDNASLGGPSRTIKREGIVNSDWYVARGGDGFQARVDPDDPNIVYSQAQYGALVRYDRKTGQRLDITPQAGRDEPPLRWNWDSPLIISPHTSSRIYFASNILFRSEDRGHSWTRVSPDLTRQIDPDTLEVMGKVWGPDAVAKNRSTSFYGNITSLDESPMVEGLLYVGTDDGLIQVSENGGQEWRRIESFGNDVPEMTWVVHLTASRHRPDRVYAAFNNHKNNDFKPYLLISDDRGRTWTSRTEGLPENGPVWCVVEDHADPDLLFLGTEFGVFTSFDQGRKWIRLKGGLPTIAVRDIALQRRESDLVLGTFGRGFYVLDDYSSLRVVDEEVLAQAGALFPVRDALQYIPDRSSVGSRGDAYFRASNPPFGALITYFIKDSLKSRKALRKEAEKKDDAPYPTDEELRAEEEEESSVVILTIRDHQGNVVRRLEGATGRGLHRIAWDLRGPSPRLSAGRRGGGGGVMVLPGEYSVALTQRYRGQWTELAGPVTFRVRALGESSLPEGDRREWVEFYDRAGDLNRAVGAASQAAEQAGEKLEQIRTAILRTPQAPLDWLDRQERMRVRLNELKRRLTGDRILRARTINTPSSIRSRISTVIFGGFSSTAAPTQTHREEYRLAAEEFGKVLAGLRLLVKEEIPQLEAELEAAGAPYTVGRFPEWKDR